MGFCWCRRSESGQAQPKRRVLSLDATCLDPSPSMGASWSQSPLRPPQQQPLSGQEEPWSPFSVLFEDGSYNPCHIQVNASVRAFVSS